jgi:potassium/chloride transporter 9
MLSCRKQIMVFWLASGDLSMYEVIVNGQDEGKLEQAAKDIDFSLEDERWWQDIKRLRRPEYLSASQELAHATDLLEAVTQWPTASFQHGRRDDKPKRFAALQRMLRQAKSRASVSDLGEAGAMIGMRSQRLPADLLESDSDVSRSIHGDNDDGDDDRGDEADDEAAVTESEANMSGSNFDEYDLDASDDEESTSEDLSHTLKRAKTTPSGTGIPFLPKKLDLRKAIWKGSPKANRSRRPYPLATTSSPTPLAQLVQRRDSLRPPSQPPQSAMPRSRNSPRTPCRAQPSPPTKPQAHQ